AGNFTVIQSGRPIHEREPLRQFHAEAPFICAAAGGKNRFRPLTPPTRQFSRDRFNHQDWQSGSVNIQKFIAETRAVCRFKFVDSKRGNNIRVFPHSQCSDVRFPRASPYVELAIVPPTFLQCPDVHINARYNGGTASFQSPGSSCWTRSTSQIENLGSSG